MKAGLSISAAIATMRSAQGVEDKEEARREIKLSTSGEYKGVDASTATKHIHKAQIQSSILPFTCDNVYHNGGVVYEAKTNIDASEILNFIRNNNHARSSRRRG
jgi:L-lactate utilization protein LutB